MKNKNIIAGAVLAIVCIVAGFAVPIKGSIINAFTGFQVNGTAPLNHTLCGNGTVYLDCTPVAAPSIHYATGHTFGVVYQNTQGVTLEFAGYGHITGGSGDSTIACLTGPHGGGLTQRWGDTTTSTGSGKPVGFDCKVNAGEDYEVAITNIISASADSWSEVY